MLMGNLFDFNFKLNNWLMVKSVPVLHIDVEPNKEAPLTPPSLRLLSGAEVPYRGYCRISNNLYNSLFWERC